MKSKGLRLSSTLLARLATSASDLERSGDWPESQLSELARERVTAWGIPVEYGGLDITPAELMHAYQDMAAACMTTTFILTQRNAACQRIAASPNETVKSLLLPDLAAGRTFSTVGISHLTTSRQHLQQPPVRAGINGDCITLNGSVPWVTGACRAQHIVTGGTLDDGRQILVALPTSEPGVGIGDPSQLLALSASQTTTLELRNVRISTELLVAGPIEKVMSQGGGGAGSLGTSALALGLCARALGQIETQADARPDLQPVTDQFAAELTELRTDFDHALVTDEAGGQLSALSIRQRSNSLVLRITQAALAISKGAGYVRGHPAELAVREAMFFLVWSCPQPVTQGVLEELACL